MRSEAIHKLKWQPHAAGHVDIDREAMLGQMSPQQYDISKHWCRDRKGCRVIEPPVGKPRTGALTVHVAAPPMAPPPPGPLGSAQDRPECASMAVAASAPVSAQEKAEYATVGNSTTREVPPAALKTMQRAASLSWDCKTVILLFGTSDFMDLAFNWAQVTSSRPDLWPGFTAQLPAFP